MNLKIGLYLLLIIFLLSHIAYGQQREIDSLIKVVQHNDKQDTNFVNTLNDLAFAYYKDNKWEEVKIYTHKAIALSQRLKYIKGEAFAYRRLSSAYLEDNANPQTFVCLNKAYELFKTLNDTLNSARTLTNIGLYYHTIKDYDLSLSYFSSALQQAEKIKRYSLQIILLGNIGDIYEKQGQINKALGNYSKALALTIKINDTEYFSFCYTNLASIELKEKNYKAALNYCNKAIAIQKTDSSVNLSDITQAYIVKSQIFFILKDYKTSRQILGRGILLAQQTHNAEDRLEIYRNVFLLDSVQQNYKAALKSNYIFHKLSDSLVNATKNQVSALYNVKFNSQRREDENKQLRISGEKDKVIIGKQHAIQVATFMVMLLICCGYIYINKVNKRVKAKNKIIAEQNLVLGNSNMVKDKLFSVISHDLRSPITQLINLINLLDNGEINKEEFSEITPVVKGDIINTLELLDNLLVWSTKQLDGFKFNPESFDVHNLVDENIKDLKNHTLQKKLVMENLIPPGTKLYADSAMVKIVLRNLMSNAIKFTPQLGTISIDCYTEKDELVLYVKDTGVGIKKADKDKLFSFTKHSTIGTEDEKGTGLGLRICREFMEINKGKIWLESEENVGTKFFTSFPYQIS